MSQHRVVCCHGDGDFADCADCDSTYTATFNGFEVELTDGCPGAEDCDDCGGEFNFSKTITRVGNTCKWQWVSSAPHTLLCTSTSPDACKCWVQEVVVVNGWHAGTGLQMWYAWMKVAATAAGGGNIGYGQFGYSERWLLSEPPCVPIKSWTWDSYIRTGAGPGVYMITAGTCVTS